MLAGTLASSRACQLAPARATACARRAELSPPLGVRVMAIRLTGRSLGPSLRIENPNEPRVAPSTNAPMPSSPATAETEDATASAFAI